MNVNTDNAFKVNPRKVSKQEVCMTGKENSPLSPKDRLIFALDFTSFKKATQYINDLKGHIGLFKVGATLMTAEGTRVIEEIQQITGGKKLFIDLKLSANDIPQQMSGVSSVLFSQTEGIEFFTVHTQNGEKILKEVVDNLKNTESKVLGVTVLTSISEKESKQAHDGSPIKAHVMNLSKLAYNTGCHGVVCSGHEVKDIKQTFGSRFIAVTPAIRPSWTEVPMDDQRRVTTPGEAILNGADYIVVGRPIYFAKDPIRAADKIVEEIAEALEERESSAS